MVNSVTNLFYSGFEKFTGNTVVENGTLLRYWQEAYESIDTGDLYGIVTIIGLISIILSGLLLIMLFVFGLKFKRFYNMFLLTFVLFNLHWVICSFIYNAFVSKTKVDNYIDAYDPHPYFLRQSFYFKDKINGDTVTDNFITELSNLRNRFYEGETLEEFRVNSNGSNIHEYVALIIYGLISIFITARYDSLLPLAYFTSITIFGRVCYDLSFSKLEMGKMAIALATLIVLFFVVYFARFVINFVIALSCAFISSIYIVSFIGILAGKSEYILAMWIITTLYTRIYKSTEITNEYTKWIFICGSMMLVSFILNVYTGGKKALLSK